MTPFRYPGGKSFLHEFLGKQIAESCSPITEYAEPYAGGCGNGALGPVFCKLLKIACLDGADFVPESLEIAKADFGYSRTYLTNVMSIDAALDGKQYDLVNSSEVIPYIPPEKYLHFFRVHRRCVSDGHHFLLTFPNLHSIFSLFSKSNSVLRYNFSPNEVLEALDEITSESLRAGEILHGIGRFVSKAAPKREAVDVNDQIREATRLLGPGKHRAADSWFSTSSFNALRSPA